MLFVSPFLILFYVMETAYIDIASGSPWVVPSTDIIKGYRLEAHAEKLSNHLKVDLHIQLK